MEEVVNRCKVLIQRGTQYRVQGYYFDASRTQELQKWITSVVNIVSLITPPHSYFYKECEKVVNDEAFTNTVPSHVIKRLTGLLEGLCDEIESGFFKQLEYIFTASAFDDFLDHAEHFHKGGKKVESSVLGSTVFEDTVRKIAKKNDVEEAGIDLESVINELVNVNIFTTVKAKRVKGHGAVRNKALHAQWDDFDLKDVGGLIKGTRELIDDYL
jgi:hypothetical protein